jgi:carbon-monoxide dehydrogenase medium subunit
MKAAALDYVRVGTVAEALSFLDRYAEGAKLVSGGQSLVPMLNLRLVSPAILVDINGIGALKSLETDGATIRIGALTRHVDLQRSELIGKQLPLLSLAIEHVAHPAIRNRGTIGGNLAHADPASELPACMLALDATMIVASSAGERRIPADEFFLGTYETALRPSDILIAIEIPIPPPGERVSFIELARRSGDYAILGLAARARCDDEVMSELTLVYFAVADRPVFAAKAAASLIGRSLNDAVLHEAMTALSDDLQPRNDPQATPEMRLHLARVLLARSLEVLSLNKRQPAGCST